jgi:two-component system, cell cycle sensor histidine kinase and response regulator CckA
MPAWCSTSSPATPRSRKKSGPIAEEIREIRGAGERAAALTRQLLAFGRRQVLELKVHPLDEIVGGIGKMLRRVIPENVAIVTRLASQGSVRVDAGQVEQVLLNMAINARDAMPDGGELSIATSDIEVDTRFAHAHPEAAPGSYVLFSVRDTGHGMDEETLRRVFEPFFTTKGLGKGTGLGLSMSYGIVKQFGGFILADSESGRGTTFHVYLPRIANSERRDADSRSEHPARGTETVLLIEDDPVVRSSTRRALRAFGYCVLEAGSGDQALTVAESHVGEIAIAVSDLVMPGMKARDAAERLAAMRPGMRFLFMSGFADETVHHDRLQGPCCDFIAKPFSGRGLAERVRELLDRA